MSIEVKFFDNGWIARLRRRLNFVNPMEKVVRRILIRARHNAPVRTGRLKASIRGRVEMFGMKGVVYSDLSYSGYVEFGTRYMQPRYYIRRAIETDSAELRADFQHEVRRQIEGR